MTIVDGQGSKATYHHGDLRLALLRAADQELADRGIEGFTLRGVARRAGVSHAAPAHHFRDRDDMLTALAAIAAERLNRSMEERQRRAPDAPDARFLASGVGYVAFALDNPQLFMLLFGSERPDSSDPELCARAGEAFRNLVDGLGAVWGMDVMDSDAGRKKVAAAWSIVHGAANLLIAGRLGFLRKQLDLDFEGTVRGLLEGAIAGAPEAATGSTSAD